MGIAAVVGAMFFGRFLRSSKLMVGISIKDVMGSKHAIKKAVSIAQPGDKVIALHVPKLVPEMLLSSMSDPSDASEETFAALANLPTKAGQALQKEMKDAAAEEMKALSKDVDIQYEVSQPSSDVKANL